MFLVRSSEWPTAQKQKYFDLKLKNQREEIGNTCREIKTHKNVFLHESTLF